MEGYNENLAPPDALDFLGNYLKKEEVHGRPVVTITNVSAETVEGKAKQMLVAKFAEWSKPLILHKTNIQTLAEIFGDTNTGLWRGQVTLYVDDNIIFAGKRVGGIRIAPAPAAAGALNISANPAGPLG